LYIETFPVTSHVETIVLLSHKSPDSVINVKVEFGKGKGKVLLVEDVCSRTVSEAELSHLLDYLLDLACDEKILELYKRVCRSICIYIPVVLRVILTHIGKCGKRKIVIQQIFLKRKENKVFQIL